MDTTANAAVATGDVDTAGVVTDVATAIVSVANDPFYTNQMGANVEKIFGNNVSVVALFTGIVKLYRDGDIPEPDPEIIGEAIIYTYYSEFLHNFYRRSFIENLDLIYNRGIKIPKQNPAQNPDQNPDQNPAQNPETE